jgi:hypothetical protein
MRLSSPLICLQERKRLSCAGTSQNIANTILLSLACSFALTMAVLLHASCKRENTFITAALTGAE